MKFKRALVLLFAALLTLSMAVPVAADTEDDGDVTYQILTGTQFSVEILGSNSITGPQTGAQPGWDATFNDFFSLDGNGYQCPVSCEGKYVYQVVDNQGTKLGWQVDAKSTQFLDDDDNAVPGATMYRYANGEPGVTSVGTTINPGAVSPVSDTTDIIGSTGVKIVNTPPGDFSTVFPNGAGTFNIGESVQIGSWPAGVAVGTYTSTLTLTLSRPV